MAWSPSFALLGLLQLGQALPKQPDYTSFSPFQVSKRQNPDNAIAMCPNNICDKDCLSVGTGGGFPQCLTYPVSDLKNAGFPVDQNGFVQAWASIPPVDAGCRVVIRSPIFNTDCAGTDLVAAGATCAPLRLDNSYGVLFCCGTDDCGALGVPRRDVSRNPFNVFRSIGSLQLLDADGNPLPTTDELLEKSEDIVESVELEEPKISERNVTVFENEKRQGYPCSDFIPDGDTYYRAGDETQVSDLVTCGGGNQPCQVRADRSTTVSFTVTPNGNLMFDFGIIKGGAGGSLAWQDTNTRAFGETFGIDAGASAYIAFVPRLLCLNGQFVGDDACTIRGTIVAVCAPSDQVMQGDVRLVQVRGG